MKNTIMSLLILAAPLAWITSCEETTGAEPGAELVGASWSHPSHAGDEVTLQRVPVLPDDDYGIVFHPDGSLTEQKNSGWCATPPIHYGRFEGTWEFLTDSVLQLNGTFWGGEMDATWQIIELTDKKLRYRLLEVEYEGM